ncbi:biliverdin-producing heme oxygenase [Pedobacter sp. MC2016-24]|uniref:biliverdin-producing heme oxygenase n=1 Tax=Pedobacter sp. MC2016-24 TaxID=2780090 RepID=UPI00187E978E|nr:biliverdin-producing heme oxygenase [Pedobacter sp. MC2016-24]MBE9598159.1 biliverdin-producing heme oxygenase [Pedobacter sp. MC2016-24]
MLSNSIKEATREAHLNLEKKVVQKMKAIRSDADYADFLKHFYTYFNQVEQAIAPYITAELLPDHAERRNSQYLKQDIQELGGDVNDLPAAQAPEINNTLQALGALYVMEGSIMGGPIIVKMLEKFGITKGVSFFSGYGEATGQMWAKFVAILNTQAHSLEEEALAIEAANATFSNFGEVFGEVSVA